MADDGNTALVIGASGGLGAALQTVLQSPLQSPLGAGGGFSQVLGLSRSSSKEGAPMLDITDEASVAASAAWLKPKCEAQPLRLLVVATGILHQEGQGPERSLAQLDAAYLQRVLAVNAIGPALLLKHFSPLLPREGEVKLVFISAKVGSIGDNALGGWYGYRASKAALNQLVKTASIELARRHKNICCVALHPGTVDTALSAPFSKNGLNVRSAQKAAQEIADVVQRLDVSNNGSFVDYKGQRLPW
jgi:NAD(P)-dependent dehydrogenase (short-subunit alcohol dehydrogenase family)